MEVSSFYGESSTRIRIDPNIGISEERRVFEALPDDGKSEDEYDDEDDDHDEVQRHMVSIQVS